MIEAMILRYRKGYLYVLYIFFSSLSWSERNDNKAKVTGLIAS